MKNLMHNAKLDCLSGYQKKNLYLHKNVKLKISCTKTKDIASFIIFSYSPENQDKNKGINKKKSRLHM